MTIKTIADTIPNELPQARLFLDDLEEIAQILLDLVANAPPPVLNVPQPETRLTITCHGKECTTVQELPKILLKRQYIFLQVNRGFTFSAIHLFTTKQAYWFATGSSAHETLAAYQRLKPIFDARKRRFFSLLRSLPTWANTACLTITLVAAIGLLRRGTPVAVNARAIPAFLALLPGLLIVAAYLIPLSPVVPRSSFDARPAKKYLLDKVVPIIIGFLLGIASTLISQALMHYLWPTH
jgi:hypothetical protein